MASQSVDFVTTRLRLVRSTAVVGFVLCLAMSVALAVAWSDAARASTVTFSLAGLVLGFAVLGWSGTVLSGRTVAHFGRQIGLSSTWSERRSRRAMARLSGLGGGGLLAASLVAFVTT